MANKSRNKHNRAHESPATKKQGNMADKLQNKYNRAQEASKSVDPTTKIKLKLKTWKS